VRWIVFETGERCQVSTWPLPPENEPRGTEPAPLCTAQPRLRFLVFESPRGRGFVRIAPNVELDRLAPQELWALFKQAQRTASDIGPAAEPGIGEP